jgi:hypothetical protein
MKPSRKNLFRLAVLIVGLVLRLSVPAVVEAQFNFTTNNGTLTITGYTGPGGAVTVPSETNGYPVTTIAQDAFLASTMISIVLPDSITNLGYEAFGYCSSLTSVAIDSGVSNNIGQYTFFNCTSLTNVIIPNTVTKLPVEMFPNCSGLATITIPASVTNIGQAAFDNCSGLKAIYCQGNAPVLGKNAFFGVNSAAVVYYLPGATGWTTTLGPLTTQLLNPQLQISGSRVQSNEFGFTISGANNQLVIVEACKNLTNLIWSPVGTNTLISGSSYFSDPQWTNNPARFYRIRSL